MCFSILSVFRSYNSLSLNLFEYFIIFLIALLSSLLLICASDLLTVYLLLEMQTLSFYVLACFKRNSSFSTEAGLKYFIAGSFISGLFLLGCSIIFFILGALNFNNLSLLLSFDLPIALKTENFLLLTGVILIVLVFLFKIAAAPFHFWSPDVYEGSPLSSTIILSILPKLPIIYVLIKLLLIFSNFKELEFLLVSSGLLSIVLGSFFAVSQKRFKRLIIYSSVAQIGFIVVALSNLSKNSLSALFFFVVIYLITSVTIWTNFSIFFNFQKKRSIFDKTPSSVLFLSNFSNFFKVNKTWAFSNILIFFSLAGIPPLVGFFSKFLIVFSLVESKNLVSSFFLLILSVVSVYYYIKMIKIIFFESDSLSFINISQNIYKDFNFEFDCNLLAFLLYLLLFLFSFPSCLKIISYLITCTFNFL